MLTQVTHREYKVVDKKEKICHTLRELNLSQNNLDKAKEPKQQARLDLEQSKLYLEQSRLEVKMYRLEVESENECLVNDIQIIYNMAMDLLKDFTKAQSLMELYYNILDFPTISTCSPKNKAEDKKDESEDNEE